MWTDFQGPTVSLYSLLQFSRALLMWCNYSSLMLDISVSPSQRERSNFFFLAEKRLNKTAPFPLLSPLPVSLKKKTLTGLHVTLRPTQCLDVNSSLGAHLPSHPWDSRWRPAGLENLTMARF